MADEELLPGGGETAPSFDRYPPGLKFGPRGADRTGCATSKNDRELTHADAGEDRGLCQRIATGGLVRAHGVGEYRMPQRGFRHSGSIASSSWCSLLGDLARAAA